VISVPMAERQKRTLFSKRDLPQKQSLIDLNSEQIYLRKVWEISTAKRSTSETDDWSQQKLEAIKQIWHHQPLTRVKWFEPLQAHQLTSLISEHSAL
jgi:hypothetical protein